MGLAARTRTRKGHLYWTDSRMGITYHTFAMVGYSVNVLSHTLLT